MSDLRRKSFGLMLVCWGIGFALLGLSIYMGITCKWEPFILGFASASFFWGGTWYWLINDHLNREEG